MNPLPVDRIQRLYSKGRSAKEIGETLGCSWRHVISCMQKNGISRRSRSEATYRKANPHGDPFQIKHRLSLVEERLKSLALGLYWGEGTRRNPFAVRISNTDPALLRVFIDFLRTICRVQPEKIRIELILHADVNPQEAISYWSCELGIPPSQFRRPTSLPSRGNGTYKRRVKWGTATVHVGNTHLRQILQDWLAPYTGASAHGAQSAERDLGKIEVAPMLAGVAQW